MPKPQALPLFIPPTPERGRHNKIELVPQAIADEYGRPAQPYRALSLLASMHKRGSISDEQREGGERFYEDFRRAHLDGLRASDWSRPIGHTTLHIEPSTVEFARDRVWKACRALGGVFSLPTSITWAVVGWEVTIKYWAFQNHRNVQEAKGILLASLDVLSFHYGLIRR